jgi:transcriptional regulator
VVTVATASDRLQGTVDVLILKTLAWKPMHGYAIAQFLADRSRGELAVESAALYQGLHRLARKRLVRSRWGSSDTKRRVRIYTLTPEGRAQLVAESDGWKRYAAAVARVLALREGEGEGDASA